MGKQGATYNSLFKWMAAIIIGAAVLFYFSVEGSARYTGGVFSWIISGILGILAIYTIVRYSKLSKEEKENQNKKLVKPTIFQGGVQIKPRIPRSIIYSLLALGVSIYLFIMTPFKLWGIIFGVGAIIMIIVSIVIWKRWVKR